MREVAVRAEARAGWAMTAPALAAIGLFFVVPAVASLGLSFTDFDIYALANLANLRFIGLENYQRLLTNPLFWQAMRNTLWFVVLGVPLIVSALARRRAAGPRQDAALEAAVAGGAVRAVRDHLGGDRAGVELPAPHPLRPDQLRAGLVGIAPVDWLGNPHTALPAILLFVAWKTFGYNMIIFLAALQAVNADLIDAARVDGAGAWVRFRHVTLPAIAPTMLLVAILTVAGMFQLFAEPYVMTQGGPAKSTVTVLYFMFEEGFKWWNLGSGAAVAFILFLCIFVTTLVQMHFARRSGAI